VESIILNPVLIVEDNEDEALLMRLACLHAKISHPILYRENGEEAIALLSASRKEGSPSHFPSLIFLDIKMPRMDGFETLSWIKNVPELAHIPVMVLTSSPMETDILRAQSLGATSYLVKPATFNGLVMLITKIRHDWLDELTVKC
jgi:CheY-like chemotaxis protein